MELLKQYFRAHLRWVLAFCGSLVIFAAVFALYQLPLRAILYPAVLCLLLFTILGLVHFLSVRKKHLRSQEMIRQIELLPVDLPEASSIEAADFRQMVLALRQKMNVQDAEKTAKYQETLDYFTMWAHQIKTPIAAMRLQLQEEDSASARQMMAELGRTEQYADMVLAYLRLGGEGTDYVFRRCELDDIVHQAVRRFSGEFILRKLQLDYQPLQTTVLTDEKWLQFVVEQILSNALKYTKRGTISIYMENPLTLCIADTGMGIAPEDLPRIFDWGYTGLNGRTDRKSSGIGLYLCRRVCNNLGVGIRASSEVGKGTVIRLDLRQYDLHAE